MNTSSADWLGRDKHTSIGAARSVDNGYRGLCGQVLLADDHPLIREGLACLLAQQGDFQVIGQAGTCIETRAMIDRLQPDVVVLDLFMHGFGGVGLVEELGRLHPGVKLLLLAEHEEAIYAPACLRAGAAGYIMKNRPIADILAALEQVATGERYASPELRLILFETQRTHAGTSAGWGATELSARELDVFHLLGMRLTTPEIATKLSLSGKTIESYYDRLKLKLRCPAMRELHAQAQEFARAIPG